MNMWPSLTLNMEKLKRNVWHYHLNFHSEVLAFRLIKRANITGDERLLILAGINYEDRSSLYEQAVKSLKKFKGDLEVSKGPYCVKLEPAYLAGNKNALLAAGFVKRESYRQQSYRKRGSWYTENHLQWFKNSKQSAKTMRQEHLVIGILLGPTMRENKIRTQDKQMKQVRNWIKIMRQDKKSRKWLR